MKSTTLWASLAYGLLATSTAAAQSFPTTDPKFENPNPPIPAPGDVFGERGEVVLTSDFDLQFMYQSESFMGKSISAKSISVSPALDFFIAPNFSVGGLLGYGYTSGDGGSVSRIMVAPVIGYNLPISPKASLWPRIGVGYARTSVSTDSMVGGVSSSSSASGYTISLRAGVPLLFHPMPHFFFGIGPVLSLDLMSKLEGNDAAKTTIFGAAFDVGGFL